MADITLDDHRLAESDKSECRHDAQAQHNMMIDSPVGAQVPWGNVTDIGIVPTPYSIQREDTSRQIDVLCNVSGRDFGSVARDRK